MKSALQGLLNLCFLWQLASSAAAQIAAPITSAGDTAKLPAYRRAESLQGEIQLSGSSAVAAFARAWGDAFRRIYRNAKVNVISKSSAAAMGDMAADPATIGMMSRAMNATERQTWSQQHGQPPLEIKVAIDAVAIYVFKDNPLQAISIEQLERIFAATPKMGEAIERWGQLGLDRDWAQRAVHRVGFDAGRGAYELMRSLVLRNGDFNAAVSAEPVSTSVVQAVGVEPGAIGYASVYYRTARTKMLPLEAASGELAQPTEADASSGKYPLARYLYLYLGTPKGRGAGAPVREFLRFVLSEEGQSVTRASGAFAIPASLAQSQRTGLGE